VLRPFWAHFDHLIFFALVVVVNFAAVELAPRVGGVVSEYMTENVMLPMLCIVTLVSAARALVKVELDELTPPVERQLAAAAGAVGFVTSLFFLLLTPTSVMDFEIERTSRELAPALIRKIRQRVKGDDFAEITGVGSWLVSELQIMIGLSVLAGVLVGLALFTLFCSKNTSSQYVPCNQSDTREWHFSRCCAVTTAVDDSRYGGPCNQSDTRE
jgi:hypothetical protein